MSRPERGHRPLLARYRAGYGGRRRRRHGDQVGQPVMPGGLGGPEPAIR